MSLHIQYIGVIGIEPCRGCAGTGGVGVDDVVCGECGGSGERVLDVTWIVTLVHNVATGGALMQVAGEGIDATLRAVGGQPWP